MHLLVTVQINKTIKRLPTLLYTGVFYGVKVMFSRCRPGMAQRVGRGIALFFHDRGTRRGWVVSSTPRQHFTGIDPVPILQEAGWAPGPVWTGGKTRPHRDSIPDRPARSQSQYRLSYPAHFLWKHVLCNECFIPWRAGNILTRPVMANYGPRARYGPLKCSIRPARHYS